MASILISAAHHFENRRLRIEPTHEPQKMKQNHKGGRQNRPPLFRFLSAISPSGV